MDINNMKKLGLDKKLFYDMIKDINEKMGYNLSIYQSYFNAVKIADKYLETELYIKFNPKLGIIISNIHLKDKRIGLGTFILNAIKDICRKNDIKTITIENALTPEMVSFCRKHNFNQIMDLFGNKIGLNSNDGYSELGTYSLEVLS